MQICFPPFLGVRDWNGKDITVIDAEGLPRKVNFRNIISRISLPWKALCWKAILNPIQTGRNGGGGGRGLQRPTPYNLSIAYGTATIFKQSDLIISI